MGLCLAWGKANEKSESVTESYLVTFREGRNNPQWAFLRISDEILSSALPYEEPPEKIAFLKKLLSAQMVVASRNLSVEDSSEEIPQYRATGDFLPYLAQLLRAAIADAELRIIAPPTLEAAVLHQEGYAQIQNAFEIAPANESESMQLATKATELIWKGLQASVGVTASKVKDPSTTNGESLARVWEHNILPFLKVKVNKCEYHDALGTIYFQIKYPVERDLYGRAIDSNPLEDLNALVSIGGRERE